MQESGARLQNSTAYPFGFTLVLSIDHITPATGKAPTVTIRKVGGVFGAPVGAVSEVGSGWYELAGNATDRNTLGECLVHVTATGCDTVDRKLDIVGFDPFADQPLHVGSKQVMISTVNGLTPIPGADVWATTDVGGTNVAAQGITDTFGNVTLMLDVGTYYIWQQRSGFSFTNPQTLVVS